MHLGPPKFRWRVRLLQLDLSIVSLTVVESFSRLLSHDTPQPYIRICDPGIVSIQRNEDTLHCKCQLHRPGVGAPGGPAETP